MGFRSNAGWCSAILVGLTIAVMPLGAQELLPTAANSSASGPNGTSSGQGGAANADFDSLIDLIQSTVAYDSWMENGTGEGEIQPFPTGVYADPRGTLRFRDGTVSMASFRRQPGSDVSHDDSDVRQNSTLRYVSLPRLERAIAQHQAEHRPLPVEMLTLAGLERIEYVLVNPVTRDLILAGPAGNWRRDHNNVLVSTDSGRPVLRLDDLLTLWRRSSDGAFGCSITPRQQALAATQQYLAQSAARPIEPSERGQWLSGLRDSLGVQDVEFFGLTPDSHLAMVLLMADYHMKLIGMGLAEGVDGVASYLETVELLPDGSAPPMAVLRWWFAMTERPIATNPTRDVFALPAGGVQVLSENEFIAARGQRVHTNQSEPLNKRFANSFTAEFEQIAAKYPLYGELKNVFDLALVLALIERENLLERSGWQASLFDDPVRLPLPRMAVPTEVETVVNHRVVKRRHIIAGISGGVWIDAQKMVTVESSPELTATASEGAGERWWWD